MTKKDSESSSEDEEYSNSTRFMKPLGNCVEETENDDIEEIDNSHKKLDSSFEKSNNFVINSMSSN